MRVGCQSVDQQAKVGYRKLATVESGFASGFGLKWRSSTAALSARTFLWTCSFGPCCSRSALFTVTTQPAHALPTHYLTWVHLAETPDMRARHACLLLLALACLSTASATSRRLLDEYLPDVIGGGEATLGRGSRGTAGDTVGVVAEHAPPAEVGEQVPPTGTTAETQPPSTEAGPPSADTQLPSGVQGRAVHIADDAGCLPVLPVPAVARPNLCWSPDPLLLSHPHNAGTGDEAIGDGESDSGFFDEIAKTVQESLSDLMGTFESDEVRQRGLRSGLAGVVQGLHLPDHTRTQPVALVCGSQAMPEQALQ